MFFQCNYFHHNSLLSISLFAFFNHHNIHDLLLLFFLFSLISSEEKREHREFLSCVSRLRSTRVHHHQNLSIEKLVITDSFLLGLNVTFPNCSYWRLVILEIEDYALCHVDNQKVLSLIFAILHDLDAHKATHLAMFRVIICHR